MRIAAAGPLSRGLHGSPDRRDARPDERTSRTRIPFDIKANTLDNSIEIKFEQRGAHAVELLSANGRVMAAHTGTKPSAYSFPTNQLASGVYFVRV
ncbi:MAG: T9SS type A sorting domain-containing protein, partial [Chitinivibrionales bacterium]|nr:T9SS type A sorting domain-containing protein [Chitinivibrionales bacterium]